MSEETQIQHDPMMSFRELLELHRRGYQVLCRLCGKPFTFILSENDASEHHMNYGVYCMNNPDHSSATLHVG